MMKLDVAVQAFDMQDISNRRFMYNPQTGSLVLGQQYGKTRGLPGSHADDLAQAGIRNGFDDFVRGWVGTGKSYPAGVIHFAPNVDAQNISLFNRAFDTLEMFQRNGALPDTVVRGFGNVSAQRRASRYSGPGIWQTVGTGAFRSPFPGI